MGDGNEYIQSLDYIPMDTSHRPMPGVPDPYYNVNPMYQNTNVMYQQQMPPHMNYQQQPSNQNISQMPQQMPPPHSQGLPQQPPPPVKGKKGRKKGSKNDVSSQQQGLPSQQPPYGIQHVQNMNGPMQNGPVSQWNGYGGPQAPPVNPAYRPPQYMQQPQNLQISQYPVGGYPPQHGNYYGRGSQDMGQGYYPPQQHSNGASSGNIANGQYQQPGSSQYPYPPVEQNKMQGPPNPYYMNQNITTPVPPPQQGYYGSQNIPQGGMMGPTNIGQQQQQQLQGRVVEYGNQQQGMPHQLNDRPQGHFSVHQQQPVKGISSVPPISSHQQYQLQNDIKEVERQLQGLSQIPQTPEVASKMNYYTNVLNSLRGQLKRGNGSNCSTPIPQHSPMLQQQVQPQQQIPIQNMGSCVSSQRYTSPQTYPSNCTSQSQQTYPNIQQQAHVPPTHIGGQGLPPQHTPVMVPSTNGSQQQVPENSMMLGQQQIQQPVNTHITPTYPTPYSNMDGINGSEYPCTTSNSSANSGGSKESIIPPEPTPSNFVPTSNMTDKIEYSSNDCSNSRECIKQEQPFSTQQPNQKIINETTTFSDMTYDDSKYVTNDNIVKTENNYNTQINENKSEYIENNFDSRLTNEIPLPPCDNFNQDDSDSMNQLISRPAEISPKIVPPDCIPSSNVSQESFSQIGSISQVTSLEEEDNTCSSVTDTINEVINSVLPQQPVALNTVENFVNLEECKPVIEVTSGSGKGKKSFTPRIRKNISVNYNNKMGRNKKRKKNDTDYSDDDDDEYFSNKKKKNKKPRINVQVNECSDIPKESGDIELHEDFYEKRRSGRRNVERSYVEQRMEYDDDEVENNEVIGEEDIVYSTVKLETLFIVEKILSSRMSKRIFEIYVDDDSVETETNVMGNLKDENKSSDEMGVSEENNKDENIVNNKEEIKEDSSLVSPSDDIPNTDNNECTNINNLDEIKTEVDVPENVPIEEPMNEEILEKPKKIITEEREVEEYFIKFKGRSYVHCAWKTIEELEVDDKRVLAKINRYKQKLLEQPFLCTDEDIFNPDYIIVERILDAQEVDGINYYFVKWRQLSYDECTWETGDYVNQALIEEYEKRNTLDQCKANPKKRPDIAEFKGILKDKVYKDGNNLREYQHEGVSWLTYCYYWHRNCILADEMGLGKTVQSVTFLQEIYDSGIHGPFLVIVPLSTLHNWEREFETWTNLNAIVYHGGTLSRETAQKYEFFYPQNSTKNKRNVTKFDAIITTFEMVVSDCSSLSQIPYRIAIIDEAHRLKNRNCRLITNGLGFFKIEHKVLLTGTPLQNNMQELFSLLNYLDPEQFYSANDFLSKYGQCQTEEQVKELQEILKPMMLRRLKEDVEKSLQPKEETIIEVQLSTIQKKYYRAILEKNFSHLCKGTSAPSLMNTMMELRKCCNHPFLISGAEETILNELKAEHPEMAPDKILNMGLIQSSGKLVLCSKLLPKLRKDGHRVLMFSQMTKTLDLIEEYLCLNGFKFERIDGNIRGDLRQAAIDRFSKEGSDRFIFLLCTKAGGVGINLTAADTCIIFDSDWNPQNDLQAQARCHRIGQKKMVKIYRLITANTYEREMFDRASMKLGLDKAVLQSMSTKENPNQLSKKDIEELLKKGAYGALMDDDTEGSKFGEEDIDTILSRRTQTITHESVTKGSTFSKATFSTGNNDDIDINDPNFWSKWAEKANIKTEPEKEEDDLILMEPRNRRKRFDDAAYKKMNGGEHSDDDENDGKKDDRKSRDRSEKRRNRRRGGGGEEDEEATGFMSDELIFNKQALFKIEKLLLIWGWGRWSILKDNSDLTFSEDDFIQASRILVLHCLREYKSDEKVRDYVWKLISPTEDGKKNDSKEITTPDLFNQGWASLPEYNPPQIAVDGIFQRHINRHTNKVIQRVYHLSIITNFILKDKLEEAGDLEKKYEEIDINLPPISDPFLDYWDSEYDKCFLIGIYRHGMENYDTIKNDETLIFARNKTHDFPSQQELNARFKRLMICYQKYLELQQQIDEHKRQKNLAGWPKEEKEDFLRVLNSYGLKDVPGSSDVIDWARFKQISIHLKDKSQEDLLALLFAIYSLLTKISGGGLSGIDVKRTQGVDISQNKARTIITRVNLMRKIHQIISLTEDEIKENLKMLVYDYMPTSWCLDNDYQFLKIVENVGLDDVYKHCKESEYFKDHTLPTEKVLIRRAFEIATTFEYGKYIPVNNSDSFIDDDSEDSKKSTALPTPVRGNTPTVSKSRVKRKNQKSQSPANVVSSTAYKQSESDLTTMEKEKMEALMMQASLQSNDPNSLAMLQLLAQSGLFGNVNAQFPMDNMSMEQIQQIQQLIILSMANGGQLSQAHLQTLISSMTQNHQQTKTTTNNEKSKTKSEEALNLAKKDKTSESDKSKADEMKKTGALSKCNFEELLQLANRSSDSRAAVINMETGERWNDDRCPKIKHLEEWLTTHPNYELDLDGKKEKEFKEKVKTKPKSDEPPKLKSMSDEKNENTVVSVFHKLTSQIVPSDKCPTLKNLASWLDKHPDFNVSSKFATTAKSILPRIYHDRIGGEEVALQNLEHIIQLQTQAQIQAVQNAQLMNPMMAAYAQYAALMASGCTPEQQQMLLLAQLQGSFGNSNVGMPSSTSSSMMSNNSFSSSKQTSSSSKKESSNNKSKQNTSKSNNDVTNGTNEALLFQQILSDPTTAALFARANGISVQDLQQYAQFQQMAAIQALTAMSCGKSQVSENTNTNTSTVSSSGNSKNSLDDQLNALLNGTSKPTNNTGSKSTTSNNSNISNSLAALAVSLSSSTDNSIEGSLKDNSKPSTPVNSEGTSETSTINTNKVKNNKLSAVLDKLNSSKD
ncbi:Chromodomain-helicase-DNA-binding protein 6 [Strongyloides ratti]|uniref:Chromodomain-helicase-DNA-binding protein 6 n=1 Tax=Strongyloides ratti TaxID=34506 RepID=A0A090LIR9_STRRB|nr:Chromodomain-helicase-DNA-binding protein 6 [Strongyloides ratti]CEF67400.1 Chromodomain-helicase-DNA-binding protein 6 [Strongyloides ratti]